MSDLVNHLDEVVVGSALVSLGAGLLVYVANEALQILRSKTATPGQIALVEEARRARAKAIQDFHEAEAARVRALRGKQATSPMVRTMVRSRTALLAQDLGRYTHDR